MFSQWCGGNATSKEQTRAEVGVTDSSRIGSIFCVWTLKILSDNILSGRKEIRVWDSEAGKADDKARRVCRPYLK
jgi:hypothetical protein